MTESTAERARALIDCEPRLLIGGTLRGASGGATFANINPATEELIGETADGTADDMVAAVDAARRAFDETSWSTDHAFRRSCLEELQAALSTFRETLRYTLIAESGSPHLFTHFIQIDPTIDEFLPYYADLATSYSYEQPLPPLFSNGISSARIIQREAIGVVGAITPWNAPLYLNVVKIAAALAAGCTVVLKPAPDTPWSATLLGRYIAEHTSIPAGVVNIVVSSDHNVGEVLTSDPRVDMISFTGSTATGKRIMKAGADSIKKVFLELGGKSARVILDDADFNQWIPQTVGGMCINAGQGCSLHTRMLLPRQRYEEGVEIAAKAMAAIPFGDPLDPATVSGPVINDAQRSRILGYIRRGQHDGAEVMTGGGLPAEFGVGFYVEPTLLANVGPDDVVAQEEIFGPVLVAIPYEDDDDAVRIANRSVYGLGGGVVGEDVDRAIALARRMRTGTVNVNGARSLAPDSPFGGYRSSGVGRENGLQGFEEFLETKTIAFPGSA